MAAGWFLYGILLCFFCFLVFYGFRAAAVCMVFPYDPQRGVYADRGIGTADEANEHDERKVLCRFAAEEMEGAAGKEYGRQGINAAVNTL